MGSLVKKQAERFLRENQRHRRWLAIFLCLALVVTSGTFAALRMNGRAMDIEGKVLDCQLKVHQHTKDCFDENGELICGQADYVVHTHSAACYDGEGKLVCQIPEREAHVHDDSCYTEEKTLICDQEEAEGHHHTQDCYTKQIGEWICTKEAHEHNELCYDAEGNLICGIEPHQHGDACYEWNEVLTCGQEESEGHTHSDECYKTEKKLTCGELELHEHDGPCYENGELTCKVPELKEHVHNEECFRDVEPETDDQLQGEEFESDGKDPGPEVVSGDTADENGEDGGTVSDDTVSGDIVSGDAVSSDTVSADTVSGNTDEAEETDEAREFSYEDDQVEINVRAAKKGIVPEDAELSVKPIVQQDVEALKEDESVSENEVAEAEELNAKYEEVQKELEASVAEDETKELAGFLAYDISFLTEQVNEETGETEKVEIEPDGSVEVSMRFADAYIPEMPEKISAAEEGTETVSENGEKQAEDFNVDVVHLKETPDTATGEMKLNAETLNADIRTTDDAKVSEVTFSADSFSMFTITWSLTIPGGEGTFPAKVNVRYWNAKTDKELEIDEGSNPGGIELKGEIETGKADTFNISDITENGTKKQYYLVKSKEGQEYVFQGAYCMEKGNWIEVQTINVVGTSVCYNNTNNVINQEEGIRFKYLLKGETGEETGLKTVPTLSNNDYNIKMYMHDSDFDDSTKILGGVYRTTKEDYGHETQGLVEADLKNGFPVTSNIANQPNQSLEQFFKSSEEDRVDHLFLQDRYKADKTFYYSSYANYAWLDQSSREFKVYDAIGTIFQTNPELTSPVQSSFKAPWGGNFFPYDPIQNTKSNLWNLFDEDGKFHSEWYEGDSSNDDQKLNMTNAKPNYHFGLYLETNFVQEPGGQITLSDGTKKDMVYEFTGDDDLWVFINDRLVLDIGGIHDAVNGTINFATGEVRVGDLRNGVVQREGVLSTTLSDIFKDRSEYIQEGTDRLKDYEVYSLKIFYLERNGNDESGGSALRMAFNLPTVEEGDVQIRKQLSNSNDKYANLPFNFKLMAAPEDNPRSTDKSKYSPITTGAYKADGKTELQFDPKDSTFQLKPGEVATFKNLKENRNFYVVETGFESDLYDSVSVNGTSCSVNAVDPDQQTESVYYAKAETDVQQVGKYGKSVVFTNNCSEKNSKEIRITKKLNGLPDGRGPFDIKVELESTEGTKVPYTGDYYLIKEEKDSEGDLITKYYKFDDSWGVVSANEDGSQQMRPCGTADKDGIVKIASGYTVVIPKLPAGTEFKVQEILTEEQKETYQEAYGIEVKTETADPATNNNFTSDSDQVVTGAVNKDRNAEITVTNRVKTSDQTYEWKIVKKGETESGSGLTGAEFTLASPKTPDVISFNGTSKEGEIEWESVNGAVWPIQPGTTYILKETKAPKNYALSGEQWEITFGQERMEVNKISGSGESQKKSKVEPKVTWKDEGKTAIYEYTFLNTCIYELPSTGGDGIYWYLVSGMCLMMASALILYKNRRKEVVRK